jgi:hypothetical protein
MSLLCNCKKFVPWKPGQAVPWKGPDSSPVIIQPEPYRPPLTAVIEAFTVARDNDYIKGDLYIWADGSRAVLYEGTRWLVLPAVDYHEIFNQPEEEHF